MTIHSGRIAELVGPRRFRVHEQRFPAPRAGRVRVRVLRVGVCASDLASWQAGPPAGQPALRLGHEPVGVVDAVADGIDGVATGTVVTGRMSPAFADYVYAAPDDLVVVPDGVDPAVAIGEPFGCVLAGYRRAQPAPGARTAVIGLGFMGLIMTRLLALSPVSSVWAIDPRPDARDTAVRIGATDPASPDSPALRPDSVDLVVEASGTQQGLALGTRLAGEHGTLAILGYHQADSRVVDMRTWNWKALDVVNAHVRDRHQLARATRAAMRLLAAGRLPAGELFTHDYPLDRIDDAYQALHDKPPGFVKATVTIAPLPG